MKNIIKGDVPGVLQQYATRYPAGSWDNFRKVKARRLPVQQQLLSDQGGLCAYCEIDLKAASGNALADLRVEHFHPKSDTTEGRNWHLDWQNLLAVCHGGSRADIVDSVERYTSPDHSCDVPKDGNDWDALILNPLLLPAFPALFRYDRSTGAMGVELDNCRAIGIDTARAQATIDLLRLDSQRLRGLRKPVLDKLNEQLRGLVQAGHSTADARDLLARAILSKKDNQSWPPFLSAARNYLGKSGEQQLTAIGYVG